MNYTELTASIKEYTDNTETTFVSNIPTFVKQTEERIYRSILIPELRKNVTTALTSSNRFLAKPTDHLATFSIAVIDGSDNYAFLLPKDVNFIREAYPATATTGQPVYYAQFDGDNFIVAPTPNSGYTVQLHYYYDPVSIVTGATSWLGDNAESVLLYGSLVEAYTLCTSCWGIFSITHNKRYSNMRFITTGFSTRTSQSIGCTTMGIC